MSFFEKTRYSTPIDLDKISTAAPDGADKNKLEKATRKNAERISDLQEMLQANGKKNLLVIFQGMDSSGKDGSTRATFGRCSPSGVSAVSFKKPTVEEFAHDFLWRVHKHAPAQGEIKVFIRSHYEDVLIQRVHKWIDEEQVQKRINAINAFEELLEFDNDTTIIKFYLHLSKGRQLEKLKERKEEEDKFFKHNAGDWEERKYWDRYRQCYEDVINQSSIPWNIVPVDQRWYRNFVISSVVLEVLENMNLKWPALKD